jgi:hypothetical protein
MAASISSPAHGRHVRRPPAMGRRTWRVNARVEPKLGVDRRKKTPPAPPRGRSAVSGTHVGRAGAAPEPTPPRQFVPFPAP